MDPRLLEHYNRELQFMREMGGEFAAEYPKIAGRLGLERLDCSDPYVERLLEGFAFLTARIQLQLSREFPRFTEQLCNIVYPNYLAPVPSMTIAQLQPMLAEAALGQGVRVPRGTVLRSAVGKGERTACEFRTAHDVTLWPLELTEAQYLGSAGALAAAGIALANGAAAGIRLRLRTTAGLNFAQLPLDALSLFLQGADALPQRLYQQIIGHGLGLVVQSRNGGPARRLARSTIRRAGFGDDEALLPVARQGFQGYRLLQEYFAFPQRFLFVSLAAIGDAVRACPGSELEIIILLDQSDPSLGDLLDADCFKLHCTPAVNLIPRRATRIHLDERSSEYHVVPDRTKPLDLEVHTVLGVTGYGRGTEPEQEFLPFHACNDLTRAQAGLAFYAIHREPRLLPSRQRRTGSLSGYVGNEVYVSLVDGHNAPLRTELRQIEVNTLCTNRDLPLQMAIGRGRSDLTPDSGAPIEAVKCLVKPTSPHPTRADTDMAWRLINQLSLNYLSIVDSADGEGAVALRDILSLYADTSRPEIRRQIEGVRGVASATITRRIPTSGPVTYGRGLEVTLTFDAAAFEGTGSFLLGAVLDEFFTRYASINSFTETVLRVENRGEVMRWPARLGRRQTL